MIVASRFVIYRWSIAASLVAALAGCGASSQLRVASTQAPAAGSQPEREFTIYAAGDVADCRKLRADDSGAAMTARLIAAELDGNPAAAVLMLGDATYPIGAPAEFDNCYEPTWGRFKARTHPAPGNHEYYTPAAVGYYRYFEQAAGPSQRGYYSVDLGAWHVVSLNSNLKAPEHAAQLAWLKADLAANATRCTLAYWHHPFTSSGGHGNNGFMQDVWRALHAAQADVVLASHDHDYERFAPMNTAGEHDPEQGIRQFVVGTGGAKLTWFGLRKGHSEVRDNSTHGVLKMVLKNDGYTWEFLPVAGGSFTDSGSGRCH